MANRSSNKRAQNFLENIIRISSLNLQILFDNSNHDGKVPVTLISYGSNTNACATSNSTYQGVEGTRNTNFVLFIQTADAQMYAVKIYLPGVMPAGRSKTSIIQAGIQLKFLTGGNLAMMGGYLGRRPTLACLWHAIPRFEGVNK